MDQISFALQEIQRESGFSEEELILFQEIIKGHRERMLRAFPNYDLFITGDWAELWIKNREENR